MLVRRSVGLVGCVCSVFYLTAPVVAQIAPPAQPVFSVSVTEAVDLVEHVGTTRRIGQSEIQRAQARTLDEALRLLPGVFIRIGADGVPRVDMRGSRARHLLLLIDGVPLTSTDDGQFDPSRIPATFIREIKVTYGSSSLLYGENAMAGVIEIATEAPPGGVHSGIGVDLRNADQRTADARLTGGSDRVAFLVAGDTFASGGFRLPRSFTRTPLEDGGVRENSDHERHTALAKINVQLADHLKIGTVVGLGNGAYGLPPSTVGDSADPFAQRPRFERVEGYHTFASQVSLAYLPTSVFDLRGWAFLNEAKENRARYDDDQYASMDNPAVSGTFRRQDKTQVSGGALIGGYDFGAGGRLRMALNGRREQFASDGVVRDVASTGGSGGGGGGRGGGAVERTFGLRSFDERRQLGVYSVASEWELRVPKDIGLVLGVAQNWQDRADGGDSSGTSWLAGATHGLTKAMSLRASISHRIRFPSIRQLYEEGTGNTALVPERSYAAEVGIHQTWGRRVEASLSGFWMRTSDFIERREELSDRFLNQDRYRFAGVETTVQAQLVPPFDVSASYSFLDARDNFPGAERTQLQTRPRHRLIVQPRWRFPAGFAVEANLHYVADQVYYSRTTPLIQGRFGDYAILDVTFLKTLAGRYQVSAGVDNVLDTSYEDAYAFPRTGRSARVRLGARF